MRSPWSSRGGANGTSRRSSILDQFEELFTLNPPEVQERFAELLGRLALEADVHVLLSMRDDFPVPLLHSSRRSSAHVLGADASGLPSGRAALRRALVPTGLACGYRFEDEALVEEMVAEVSIGERGALPLAGVCGRASLGAVSRPGARGF